MFPIDSPIPFLRTWFSTLLSQNSSTGVLVMLCWWKVVVVWLAISSWLAVELSEGRKQAGVFQDPSREKKREYKDYSWKNKGVGANG